MNIDFQSDRARIEQLTVSAYTIPTSSPESDGTLEWDATTIVIVELMAGGMRALGYSYACRATAELIEEKLRPVIVGLDAMDTSRAWSAMVHSIRNLGRPGIASMAISAVDTALWDLKARLLQLPLAKLLGMVRDGVPIYGSGGFTSYSMDELQRQLGGWAHAGIPRVKMKVGRNPGEDLRRVNGARCAVGEQVEIFVDANGAYSRKEALRFAESFRQLGVSWFEEPVPSDDLEGLRLLRDRAPAGMDIAAGEYGYHPAYFRTMLEAGSVDVLQADVTRCGGVTGFLNVAAQCCAFGIPLSAHCAPSLHVPLGCAVEPFRHLEYFHDHVRIERMLFDGIADPVNGLLYPDLNRPGFGLELRRSDAQRFAA